MNGLSTAAAVILIGLSTFLRKLAVDRIHPYQLQVVAGAVYALEVPLWLWLLRRGGVSSYDPLGVALSALCVMTSVAGAVLFSHLLRSSESPGTVATFFASNPLVVMVLSYLFLGEQLTVRKLIGCIFTIIGLSLVSG